MSCLSLPWTAREPSTNQAGYPDALALHRQLRFDAPPSWLSWRLAPGVFYPPGWALGWEKLVLDAISVWLSDHWNELAEFAEAHDKAIVAAGTAVLALFTIVLAAASCFSLASDARSCT